ncbi:unnamed protein product [Trichobilharzia szidati]|nr:unnamed protein product [Trichobilharzia szidati]
MSDSVNQHETLSNTHLQFPPVIIPKINYFPCSSINQNETSYMKLNIHWPKYFLTHKPVAPMDVTSARLSSTVPSTGSPSIFPLRQLNEETEKINKQTLYTFQKSLPVACLQLKIRFLSNRTDSKIVVNLGSNKQTIRALLNTDDPNDYSYDQEYDIDDEDEQRDHSSPSSTSSYTSRTMSRLDWSIFKEQISDLQNNNSTLPYNIWINVTIPIYTTNNNNTENTVYNNQYTDEHEYAENKLVNIIAQSDEWIAFATVQSLNILSTSNVCLDDIYLFTMRNQNLLKSTCQRKVSWLNASRNNSIQILRINSLGYPILNMTSIRNRMNSINSKNNIIIQSFKSMNSKKHPFYNGYHILWIAGSLILALFIIFLAILFIITFSLSVICSQRKISTNSPVTTINNDISSRNKTGENFHQHNRRKVYSHRHHHHHHCEDNSKDGFLQILPEDPINSLFNDMSSNSLHGLLYHSPFSGQQLELHSDRQQQQQQKVQQTSTGHQQHFLDDNSTELSLYTQDDQNELMNSVNRQTVDGSDNASATSAIQLLRNWNFYKQRAIPCCRCYSPTAVVNAVKYSGLVQPNALNTSMFLCMENHPLFNGDCNHNNITTTTTNNSNTNAITCDNLEENVMYRCHSRVGSPRLPPAMPEGRQSLILSVNANNELVILPPPSSTTTTTNSSTTATTNDNNSSRCYNQKENVSPTTQKERNTDNMFGVLNSLSEEDAEATRLEMAASVGALDQYLHHEDRTLDGIDYTLSTVPRSLIGSSEPPPSYSDSLPS